MSFQSFGVAGIASLPDICFTVSFAFWCSSSPRFLERSFLVCSQSARIAAFTRSQVPSCLLFHQLGFVIPAFVALVAPASSPLTRLLGRHFVRTRHACVVGCVRVTPSGTPS